MSVPILTPKSTLSAIALPITGTIANVNFTLPYKIYSEETSPLYSTQFLSGAADQVSYVYKKLGGDVLDIEMTEGNVYAAYEEAVLEYSYLINVHQASNVLSSTLGNTTGSFDSKGNLQTGALSSSLSGSHIALKYPKFDYSLSRKIGEGVGSEIGLNGSTQYSASFPVVPRQQEYDLQEILSSQSRKHSTGSITISNIANLAAGNSIAFSTTDGTAITASVTTGTPSSGATNTPSFALGSDVNEAAVNLAAALNPNSKISATATAAKVTIIQAKAGSGGNGKFILTDPAPAGMTSAEFVGGSTYSYTGKIEGKRVLIKKVFYKTPHAMWRFFGYYGGLNVVGNMHSYGQFSDDSTFQLIPAWHNKAQAMAFEDAIYTRMSQYSYELKDNKIRLYPTPFTGGPKTMMVEFSVIEDAWANDHQSTDGVNNLNTLPIGNLPFGNINSIGKQWIRRFTLSLCKEILGQIRSKFSSIPVPGDNITLNGPALISEAKAEQDKLREELKTTLAEMTYAKLAEKDASLSENTEKVLEKIPNYIFVG
jgi:hypothetical protein